MSEAVTYTQPPKNTRGIQVAQSWAQACGITTTKPTNPNANFAVRRQDGSLLNVRVYADNTVAPAPDLIQIPAQQLQSRNREVSLPAFHQMTQAAGFGAPIPVDRGAIPSRTEIYGQDIFLTAVRHRELRDSPNLTKEKEEFYRPVVERETRRAARKGQFLPFSYEFDDLKTFAWCWTTIFAHLYEVPPTNPRGQDNYRLLSCYLRQRFAELSDGLKSRADHSTDREDVAEPVDSALLPDELLIEREEAEEAALSTSSTLPPAERDILIRKRASSARLRQKLAEMPHQKMIDALEAEATNPLREDVTRKQARKILTAHQRSCPACGGVRVLGSNWDQSSSGAAP